MRSLVLLLAKLVRTQETKSVEFSDGQFSPFGEIALFSY
jgi:hypothetical protein